MPVEKTKVSSLCLRLIINSKNKLSNSIEKTAIKFKQNIIKVKVAVKKVALDLRIRSKRKIEKIIHGFRCA